MCFSSLKVNYSDKNDVLQHFDKCKDSFNPPLQTYVNIDEYAEKIINNAIRIECWKNKALCGLLAVYYNDDIDKKGFITNVSVSPEQHGKGIATKLLKKAFRIGRKKGFNIIVLEVMKNNEAAMHLYRKNGFVITKDNDKTFEMTKVLITKI